MIRDGKSSKLIRKEKDDEGSAKTTPSKKENQMGYESTPAESSRPTFLHRGRQKKFGSHLQRATRRIMTVRWAALPHGWAIWHCRKTFKRTLLKLEAPG